MKPGDRLPNGALVLDTARNEWGELYVLALWPDNGMPYVTWCVPDDDPARTAHGHYYDVLADGVASLALRVGGK